MDFRLVENIDTLRRAPCQQGYNVANPVLHNNILFDIRVNRQKSQIGQL